MDTLWGLDLDMSAVRLMRREGEDWVEQAVEPIDSPDIEERLEKLIAPIEDGGPVVLFLPRDQILYTVVEVDAGRDTQAQIERAMEGRTPYTLNELSLDWQSGSRNNVRVAAIARDTLDEAAAFAEVRNLKIAGYSTLFSGEDFDGPPDFDGPNTVSLDDAPEPPVAFTTARVPSKPPEAAIAAASVAASAKARFTPQPAKSEPTAPDVQKPVVEVQDATPVVQVKPPMMPLDPGLPIAAPNAPPRVRTDIAAASVSGHAASLTPPSGSVRMRQHRPFIGTLAVFAVAFLLTVGIAILVWNALPMRPGSTVEAPVDTGALPRAVVEDTAPAVVKDAEPEAETAAIQDEPAADPVTDEAEVAVEGDLIETAPLDAASVVPNAENGIARPVSPVTETAPTIATPAPSSGPDVVDAPRLAAADAGTVPEVDRETPPAPLPTMTAEVQTNPPFLGPDPDTDDNSDSIYTSAFELPDPSTDAIALPDIRRLTADDLPDVSGEAITSLPPEPLPEPVEPGDPVASAVEQALADALAGPGGLIQTELAQSVPETTPRARPDRFTEDIERQRFGGRTLAELEDLRPPARPESAQTLAGDPAVAPSELAIAASLSPRTRPGDFDALVATARAQQEAARVTASAAVRSPDTSSAIEAALEDDEEPTNRAVRPRSLSIPTTASVARQATIQNAIRLNRINLVGVYGAPSDRRALVRLSSGRYVKVKVGDRVDGGTVAQITDSTLYYRKGNRTLSLSMPQG